MIGEGDEIRELELYTGRELHYQKRYGRVSEQFSFKVILESQFALKPNSRCRGGTVHDHAPILELPPSTWYPAFLPLSIDLCVEVVLLLVRSQDTLGNVKALL